MGRKWVERLMREADIAGISLRRGGFTRRDPTATLAPDLVERDFTASAPNRLWVTDLTMISTDEGPLWLSTIRDAFSRRVVAWETSARADADLVLTKPSASAAASSPRGPRSTSRSSSTSTVSTTPAHPETARLPQAGRVRGEALRRSGTDRTSEPETPSTLPG